MCGGGTLHLLATASINANCPCVSSPVARKVINEPLYQTERSRDCRLWLNAMDSMDFMFAALGASPGELILRSMTFITLLPVTSWLNHIFGSENTQPLGRRWRSSCPAARYALSESLRRPQGHAARNCLVEWRARERSHSGL